METAGNGYSEENLTPAQPKEPLSKEFENNCASMHITPDTAKTIVFCC
jgi:hypothetical protein